jgi:hypothetical protein
MKLLVMQFSPSAYREIKWRSCVDKTTRNFQVYLHGGGRKKLEAKLEPSTITAFDIR